MTRSAPVVLYVVSRFPAVTETFVVNEWLALSERFQMQLVALRRTREGTVHPETRRAMPSVRFAGLLRPATVAAHLFWLVRRPRVYLSVLAAVACEAAPLLPSRGGEGDRGVPEGRGAGSHRRARRSRPRARALRQPRGDRGAGSCTG